MAPQKKGKASQAKKTLKPNIKTSSVRAKPSLELSKKPSSLQKAGSVATKMPPPRVQSVQLHRTTDAISVSELHSFELAKTLMTATISTIVALRDIFPRVGYAIRTYDCADPQFTYQAFMAGSSGKFQFERTEDTLNWKVLQRGLGNTEMSRAVNKLLDWIEVAAADALEKKYLAKLQLSFHSIDNEAVSDANLIEAYSICFTYENGLLHVGVAQGRDGVAKPIVLQGAKADLYTLVQDVGVMIQERGPLPTGRRMNMGLLFNDTCPQEYQPFGFHANNNPDSLIASNKGAIVGSINTGFHGISVKLFERAPKLIQPPLIDSNRSLSRKRGISVSSEIEGGETQERALKLFRGMGRERAEVTRDTQPLDMTAQTSMGDQNPGGSQSTPTFLPYTQEVMARIDIMRESKVANEGQQDSDSSDGLQLSGRLAACECGVLVSRDGHSDDMLLQCDICDNLKHTDCYAFVGIVPPKQKFACYSCLIDDGEMLSEMRETCVKRRILAFFPKNGDLSSLDELVGYIGRDEMVTEKVLHQLEAEGYVQKGLNYGKARKGKSKASEPLFKLVADDRKLEQLFRPDLDLAHYLSLPESLSPVSSVLRSSLSSAIRYRSILKPQSNQDQSIASSTTLKNNISLLGAPGHIQDKPTATHADVSSTEGTPGPNSVISRRQILPPFQIRRPLSLGASVAGLTGDLPSTKLISEMTPDPELTDSALDEDVEGSQFNEMRNHAKTSIVNSPWTFRASQR